MPAPQPGARSLFGLEPPDDPEDAADAEAVRRTATALEQLEPRRAKLVAGIAFLLSRVAAAELPVTPEETLAMERVLRERMHLPEPEAVLAVEIAKTETRLLGVTERLLVTRELDGVLDSGERLRLLDSLYAIAAADGHIDGNEEDEIRKIATELKLAGREVARTRAAFRAYRRGPSGGEGRGRGGGRGPS